MVTDQDASVSLDDFITGMIAALARRERTTVALRPDAFYPAMEKAFQELEQWATTNGTEVTFWFRVDPVHADAPDVRNAITRAVRDDLVSLDNPTYQHMRIKINRLYADQYLAALTGGAELYDGLAQTFLDAYASAPEPEYA